MKRTQEANTMQISNEMVEAFGNAFWSVNASSKIDGQRQHIRSALEAALSTGAEPVGWQPRYKQEVIDHLRTVSDNVWEFAMTVFPTKEQAEEYGHGGHDVRPLYAEPVKTAPGVSVKAIEPVWIKHDGKSMPVNAETVVEVRMADGFEHEENLAGNWLEREGSKSNWHHDLGCPHPCDIVAYRIVKGSPALSAQVQDVAAYLYTSKSTGGSLVGFKPLEQTSLRHDEWTCEPLFVAALRRP